MTIKEKGLWANIWAKRKAGKKMRKKGEKGAPTPDAIRSAQSVKKESSNDRLASVIKRHAGTMDYHTAMFKKTGNPIHNNRARAAKKAHDIAVRKQALATEDAPTMNTSAIPDPKTTVMGPRVKSINVTDRRRKKNQVPVLLKRFRNYYEDITNDKK